MADSPFLSSELRLALLRIESLSHSLNTGNAAEPIDPLHGDPYSVRRVPCGKGMVLLIGYDGRGDVMLEFRIPERKYTKRLVQRMERWLRENDDATLHLVT